MSASPSSTGGNMSQMARKQIPTNEIDDWIDSHSFTTLRGGEYVVENIETFDYPVETATEEEMTDILQAFDRVLKRYRDIKITAQREKIQRKVADIVLRNDESSEDRLIQEFSQLVFADRDSKK